MLSDFSCSLFSAHLGFHWGCKIYGCLKSYRGWQKVNLKSCATISTGSAAAAEYRNALIAAKSLESVSSVIKGDGLCDERDNEFAATVVILCFLEHDGPLLLVVKCGVAIEYKVI